MQNAVALVQEVPLHCVQQRHADVMRKYVLKKLHSRRHVNVFAVMQCPAKNQEHVRYAGCTVMSAVAGSTSYAQTSEENSYICVICHAQYD